MTVGVKTEEVAEAPLNRETLNQNVLNAEYAVRGKLYQAAVERAATGKNVTYTNVGNPHALGQKPITFMRQVLALVNYPTLIEQPELAAHFPKDAIERAKTYIANTPGGTGAYQDSRGNAYVRQEVADFLTERDGYPAKFEDVYLTDGASQGISLCLFLAIRGRGDGILTPVPQYPLYSASIELRNGTKCSYYLDEECGWGLSIGELERSVKEARSNGVLPRAIVIINPGNPTGQCLTVDNMKEIVRFCVKEKIAILADEVYQTNIYSEGSKFVSFLKVVQDMGEEAKDCQLVSFHTVSKGVVGECGRRGGFFHLHNIPEGVVEQMYKVMSTSLSANVEGMLVVGMMVNPPKVGDESYELYHKETNGTLESLKRRAKMIYDAFSSMRGVSCNPVEGALYCYPNVKIPAEAVEAAEKKGIAPDVLYCLELLDATGICTIPGSGFHQKEGTFHLRTTILPPEDQFEEIVKGFMDFHESFLSKYNAPEDF